MSRTKIDPIHIQQLVFDEDTESYKMKMVGTEMSVELSHSDGDSVYAIIPSMTVSTKDVPQSCSGMKRVCAFKSDDAPTELKIEISPKSEGDEFYTIATLINKGPSEVMEICAVRIRMSGTGAGSMVISG